jgi:hypothetical protein
MRFLISARIPTEDGNKMVQDPNFLSKIEKYVKKVNAEATYFFEAGGNRIATFIVDIQSAGSKNWLDTSFASLLYSNRCV